MKTGVLTAAEKQLAHRTVYRVLSSGSHPYRVFVAHIKVQALE